MKKILFLFVLLFCTTAIAHTVNWYVDNQIYQTTTCASGNDVTPPTPPTKHGYTFVGWYDTNVALGSWFRVGNPTPDNPIYPTFYQDGNLILRAVGSGVKLVADSYDQTTGKITRRVGVKILTGTEDWITGSEDYYTFVTRKANGTVSFLCSHFSRLKFYMAQNVGFYFADIPNTILNVYDWAQWLADQYANGTPVTIYYPLDVPVEENYVP